MQTKDPTFLVVEDNELDHEKIRRSFARLKIDNPMIRAVDGLEALDLMRGVGDMPMLLMPYIVLLDLNMPRMNGLEFLEEVRSDPKLSHVPIFVLTTSDHPRDIELSHKFNVAGYIVKPIQRDQMLEALTTLDMFWRLCEFPTGA